MSQKLRFIAKLAVTLSLLGYLFLYRVDAAEFLRVVLSASLPLLLAAAAVQATAILLAVARWAVILRNFGITAGYLELARITFIGFFFNQFLPSGIGGDFFRAYFLGQKTGRGMSTTLTTTVLERSAGLLALLSIGLVSSFVFPQRVQGFDIFWIFLGLAVLYAMANVALFHSWTHRQLGRLMRRLNRENLEEKMGSVVQGLSGLRRSPASILNAVLLSFAIQFLAVVVVWVAATAIGIEAPFRVFLIFIPLVNLTIMVPITINGLGLREGLYILLFQQIGVSPEAATTLSLLNLVVFLISGLPGAIFYSLRKREAVPRSQAAREESHPQTSL